MHVILIATMRSSWTSFAWRSCTCVSASRCSANRVYAHLLLRVYAIKLSPMARWRAWLTGMCACKCLHLAHYNLSKPPCAICQDQGVLRDMLIELCFFHALSALPQHGKPLLPCGIHLALRQSDADQCLFHRRVSADSPPTAIRSSRIVSSAINRSPTTRAPDAVRTRPRLTR